MDLSNSLILALVGFVLTTVAGGLLGAFLQNRVWRHQWIAQRRSQVQAEARAVFEEVSRLMDKRLFRTSQLRTWIDRRDEERTKIALGDYRDVMKEWNDSINRNLSLLQFYFGESIRQRFDFGVGKTFVDIGSSVEEMYRARDRADAAKNAAVAADIERLRAEVYAYNLSMLHCWDKMAAEARPKYLAGFGGRMSGEGQHSAGVAADTE